MAKKARPTDAEAKIAKYSTVESVVNSLASVLNGMFKWGGIAAACGFLYLSIDTLAGQTTNADIGVRLLADVKLSEVFAYIFGSGAVAYGWRQRSLRKSTIERLQGRIRSLESILDPDRSSSGLTTRGDTPPKDAI